LQFDSVESARSADSAPVCSQFTDHAPIAVRIPGIPIGGSTDQPQL
jgi:hypothetical protein